ncbi:GNAT family N-acetyltransferase [Muricoccus radiodurans]|uniref:GNAT family N-acetyltransferase n=1 Tax=Muricoccus radiodurans TaxID=2231721 RepID=UPI003CF38576
MSAPDAPRPAAIGTRRAEPRDAPALAALLRLLNDEPGLHPGRLTPDRVLHDLIEDPRAVVLLAERDGIAAGLATAHPTYDSGTARWGLFLNDLIVAPGSRRRGIARALLAAMAAEARRQGGAFLWWNGDEGDDLALAFHRATGAAEANTVDFTLAGEVFDRMAGAASPGEGVAFPKPHPPGARRGPWTRVEE